MKQRKLGASLRTGSRFLLAGTLLPTLFLTSTNSYAIDSTSNISSIARLENHLEITLGVVQNLRAERKREGSALRSQTRINLDLALSAAKQAGVAFGVALRSGLFTKPESVILLKNFAQEYNLQVAAKSASVQARFVLNRDAATILEFQKGLKGVAGGGQSDMNSELGSMRLTLSEAPGRISTEEEAAKKASDDLALATSNLKEATRVAELDPLAAIAIKALMAVYAHSSPLKMVPKNPLSWI